MQECQKIASRLHRGQGKLPVKLNKIHGNLKQDCSNVRLTYPQIAEDFWEVEVKMVVSQTEQGLIEKGSSEATQTTSWQGHNANGDLFL